MRKRNGGTGKNESGVALIGVLCLLFSLSALTAALVATSQLTTRNIRSYDAYMRSGYAAEGALARLTWLLAADTAVYPSERELGEVDAESYDDGRFLPDGAIREFDYYGTKIRYRVSDACRGWDLSNENYAATLEKIQSAAANDEELDSDEIQALADRISDYTDTDDATANNGAESGDYQARELGPLPRNNPLQFREELLYIQGFRARFPTDGAGALSAVRLIAPDGLAGPEGNPSLFSATKLQLKVLGGLDGDTADEVLAGLGKFRKGEGLLSETVDSEILSSLKQAFRTGESGFYTVEILRAGASGSPSARLVASFSAVPAAGPDEGLLKYLEFLRY